MQTRHVWYCWTSWNELNSRVLQKALAQGQIGVDKPAKTYIHQICVDTGYRLLNQRRVMDAGDRWGERDRESEREEGIPCYQYNLLLNIYLSLSLSFSLTLSLSLSIYIYIYICQ